jgi:Peptidase A4 family
MREITAIVTCFLLVTTVWGGYSVSLASPINSQTSNTATNCTGSVVAHIAAAQASVATSEAVAIAISNGIPASISSNSTYIPGSTNEIWSFDSQCNVELRFVNVVFYPLRPESVPKTSVATREVVVTESPELAVINITNAFVVTHGMGGGTGALSKGFSGYAFFGNWGHTAAVYQASASWYVPKPVQPPTNNCQSEGFCVLSLWPGLEPSGGNDVVQTGTDSILNCTSGCSKSYQGWYEYYPNYPYVCGSFPVTKGDNVYADVYSDALYGGNVNDYYTYMLDYTSGYACSSSQTFNMGTPVQGSFYLEATGGLAEFSTITMVASMYVGGTIQSINYPYNQGWYSKSVIHSWTCGLISCTTHVKNTDTGAPYSAGWFDITWLTSQYS